MNFNVIDKNAEDMLYALLVAEGQKASSQKIANIRFLHCRFFHIAMKIGPDDICGLLDGMPDAEECALYFCGDGDIIIKWSDGPADMSNCLIKAISEKFGESIKKYMSTEEFFVDYSMVEGWDVLKSECAKKLGRQSKHSKELVQYFKNEALITTLSKTVQLTKMQRTFRALPHILIVEDQIFSQKVLTSILKDYTCYLAKGSGEALLLYMEKCPDIVLLDIELPDINGHNFAKLVDRIDEDSFVVMVSGNQYEKDIKTSKENNVKGFITKPYEKETILKVIEQFKKFRKKRAA